MNLSRILHPLDNSGGAKLALARALALAKWHDAERQTLMTSSREPELDSDIYSMVAGRASQANPIGGLVSW